MPSCSTKGGEGAVQVDGQVSGCLGGAASEHTASSVWRQLGARSAWPPHRDAQVLVVLVAVELDDLDLILQLLCPLLQGGQDHLAGSAPAGRRVVGVGPSMICGHGRQVGGAVCNAAALLADRLPGVAGRQALRAHSQCAACAAEHSTAQHCNLGALHNTAVTAGTHHSV